MLKSEKIHPSDSAGFRDFFRAVFRGTQTKLKRTDYRTMVISINTLLNGAYGMEEPVGYGDTTSGLIHLLPWAAAYQTSNAGRRVSLPPSASTLFAPQIPNYVDWAALSNTDLRLANWLLNQSNSTHQDMTTISTQPLSLIDTPHLLRQSSVSSLSELSEAIAKEKARLVRDIMLGRPEVLAPTSTPDIQLPRSSRGRVSSSSTLRIAQLPISSGGQVSNTLRIANAIGSEIRHGHPYIDVTQLPGIETVEDAHPHLVRNNRGGVAEAFPEVS
jgi:hypothetical protein